MLLIVRKGLYERGKSATVIHKFKKEDGCSFSVNVLFMFVVEIVLV